jgi:hypothetical protein
MRDSKKLNTVLWILQGFLALFFAIASGGPKLVMSAEALSGAMPIPIPEAFLKFIGICEVSGALGLILPGVTRIRPGLTTLAAAALAVLTLCATTYQLMASQPGNAGFAIGMGLICAFVAYGRWRPAPLLRATRTPALATAS